MANQKGTQTQMQYNRQTQVGTCYMITSPHTKAECMQVLEQTAAKGQQEMSQWKFGCRSGDHTAYAIV
jgi:hypothetical protein